MALSDISEYRTKLDLLKRVANHLGQDEPITTSDPGKLVEIFNNIYGKMRQVELRRNVWRFAIRRAAIRPRDLDTRSLVAPAWSSTTGTVNPLGFYPPGCIVQYNSRLYVSNTVIPNTDTPGTDGSAWQRYFGPMDVTPWDATQAYFPGELVYKATGDGTVKVYMAIYSGAKNDPAVAEDWSVNTTYSKGQIVKHNSLFYYSNVDLNKGNTPGASSQWTLTTTQYSQQWNQVIGASVEDYTDIYPIGSGPASQTFTRNAYRLPAGFLRRAPEDPKAGAVSILGAPTNVMYRDYDYEGDFIVTRDSQPILLRFVGDVINISQFDPMFAEALTARIAMAACEPVTQSTDRLKNIVAIYTNSIREARLINGIEIGAEMPPIDDWISTRL